MSLQFSEIYPDRLVGLERGILTVIGRAASDHALAGSNPESHFEGSVALSSDIVDRPIDVSGDAGHDLRECDCDELVKRMVAAFRDHSHVNNVLTHICGSQWARVEQALRAIVNPATLRSDLSPLARNLVELMWAERGVTGRILKPYLHQLLARSLSRDTAHRLLCQIGRLCSETDPAHPGSALRLER